MYTLDSQSSCRSNLFTCAFHDGRSYPQSKGKSMFKSLLQGQIFLISQTEESVAQVGARQNARHPNIWNICEQAAWEGGEDSKWTWSRIWKELAPGTKEPPTVSRKQWSQRALISARERDCSSFPLLEGLVIVSGPKSSRSWPWTYEPWGNSKWRKGSNQSPCNLATPITLEVRNPRPFLVPIR